MDFLKVNCSGNQYQRLAELLIKTHENRIAVKTCIFVYN